MASALHPLYPKCVEPMSLSDPWLIFLCVNFAFAGVALSFGFFVGVWYIDGQHNEEALSSVDAGRQALDRERALTNTERVCDLAIGVVSDIGEHSTRVHEITNNLQALDLNDLEATGAGLVSAMAELLTANSDLQQQLTAAQEQIKLQAEEIREYEIESRTDALTGLANRRAFDDELARRYSQWQRKATIFSLLILDLDHYKCLNDQHGHQAGDEVLRRVGELLRYTCRDMDLPCRYGGEEFAVILPATTAKEATISAERLRKGIEALELIIEGKTIRVTCSLGVAQVIPAEDIVHILKRADEALYYSKSAGRNCCHFHNGIACVPLATEPFEPSPVNRLEARPRPASQVLDGLTNRTRFVEELRRGVADAKRSGEPLAVMTVQVVNHHEVQQIHGALPLVQMLESVARCLVSTFRPLDLVARLNDHTFVVLMPGTPGPQAGLVGEQLEQALGVQTSLLAFDEPRVEVALGMATCEPADTVESLIRRAEIIQTTADKLAGVAGGVR